MGILLVVYIANFPKNGVVNGIAICEVNKIEDIIHSIIN